MAQFNNALNVWEGRIPCMVHDLIDLGEPKATLINDEVSECTFNGTNYIGNASGFDYKYKLRYPDWQVVAGYRLSGR